MNVDEKIKRLPKWAQQHINLLNKKNEALISLLNREEKSDIKVDLYMSDCQRYIPERSTIRMKLSPGLHVDVRLRQQDRLGKVVEITTSDQAIICPESTNHLHIISARRFKVVAEDDTKPNDRW